VETKQLRVAKLVYFVFLRAKFYRSITYDTTQEELDELRAQIREQNQASENPPSDTYYDKESVDRLIEQFKDEPSFGFEGFCWAWQRLIYYASDSEIDRVIHIILTVLCSKRAFVTAYREEVGFLMQGRFGAPRQPKPRVWNIDHVEELLGIYTDFHLRLRRLRSLYHQPKVRKSKTWQKYLQDEDAAEHPEQPRIPTNIIDQFGFDDPPSPRELARECTAAEWNERHENLQISADRVGKIIKEHNQRQTNATTSNSMLREFGDLFKWAELTEHTRAPDCYPNCGKCLKQSPEDRPPNCLYNGFISAIKENIRQENENGAASLIH
jgi:hypothetical protein